MLNLGSESVTMRRDTHQKGRALAIGGFDGKVAVVTGGGGGLGTGIVTILAERGARVAVCDLSVEGAAKVAASIDPNGGSVRPFVVDIADRASTERLVSAVLSAFGQIDILVNNAGVHGAEGFEETDQLFREQDWDLTFRVNVKGTVFMTESVIEHMIARRQGKIVNTSSHAARGELPSGAGVPAAPSGGAYGASKAAVLFLTQTYANRLGPHNINVNCVCPGSIFTPLWAAYARWAAKHVTDFAGLEPEQVYEKAMRLRTPLGRAQTAEDIGKAVAFFASDDASNITGQSLNVNGGQRMN
jgi:NAD(P)-dependent dehydrogenase (short-subunit alcohol dehydrogenase family)